MEGHRRQIEMAGKILKFPRFALRRRGAPSNAAKPHDGHGVVSTQQRAPGWINLTWALLAWSVAMGRVRFAITQHKVFGVEASLAFLVAVLIPLLRAKTIAHVAREVVVALTRAIDVRRRPSSTDR
jgi:hypothetical protein